MEISKQLARENERTAVKNFKIASKCFEAAPTSGAMSDLICAAHDLEKARQILSRVTR